MHRKPTVLIADDDRALVAAIAIRLNAQGYETITCMDGADTMMRVRAQPPDVIVLDVHMPATSGLDVQQMLQMFGDISDTPVIYITGDTSDEVAQTSKQLGAFAVVHKPFQTEKLLETIEAALELSAQRW